MAVPLLVRGYSIVTVETSLKDPDSDSLNWLSTVFIYLHGEPYPHTIIRHAGRGGDAIEAKRNAMLRAIKRVRVIEETEARRKVKAESADPTV